MSQDTPRPFKPKPLAAAVNPALAWGREMGNAIALKSIIFIGAASGNAKWISHALMHTDANKQAVGGGGIRGNFEQ